MNNFKFSELNEDEEFDPTTICTDTPFTQAKFYGGWQKKLNRKVRRFLIYRNDEIIAYFQLVKYPLIFGRSYFYAPYGPVIKNTAEDFLKFLLINVKKILKEEKAVFARLDFTPVQSEMDVLTKYFKKAPVYTYHSAYFQPRLEWFLDLDKTEDQLLGGMHPKTRYAINFAKKKGIETEIISKNFQKYFDYFYDLMDETASRNGFSLHSKNYYKSIFESLDKDNNAYLVLSRYEGEILVTDVIIIFGRTANYVFGASSNKHRNLMPSYAAQWTAICHAKELDCKNYNFGGIADESKTYKGWEGLSYFKRKFGGKEVRHSNFLDVIGCPFLYHLYNFRKRIKKMSFPI